MITKSLVLTVLQISTSVCQYAVDNSMRADIRFDYDNDRFDVSNIIKEQNRAYPDQPTAMDFEDGRRRYVSLPNGKNRRRRIDYRRFSAPMQEPNNDQLESDVTIIIQDQNDEGRRTPMEYEYRRRHFNEKIPLVEVRMKQAGKNRRRRNIYERIPLVEVVKYNRRHQSNGETKRMNMDDFVYHDQMLSGREDDDDDYESKLAKFRAQNARRGLQIIDVPNFQPTSKKTADIKKDPKGSGNVLNVAMKWYEERGAKQADGRKMMQNNTDNDLLLKYAVPINLKVNGFLEVPQV